jgi:hypothetical protein
LLRGLSQADAVVVKGGRNHELLVGTLARPLWTGYVLTQEFTEAQAGYDAREAPLVLVHSTPDHRPWWGWRGRAHRTVAVAEDRVITAAWSTIADHERRARTNDPDLLYVDLAWMVEAWPQMRQDYAQLARTEIGYVAARLAKLSRRTRDRELIRRAGRLTAPEGGRHP